MKKWISTGIGPSDHFAGEPQPEAGVSGAASAHQASLAAWIRSTLSDRETVRKMLGAEARAITRAASLMVESLRAGGKILICGNGGSAAEAQHIAAELVGRIAVERSAIAAIALTVDTSVLTAVANDYGYERVFERQLRAVARPGDALIAITTSGRSENVVRACRAARDMGVRTIGLTGASGVAFARGCDVAVTVSAHDTALVQECHIVVAHILCSIVEAELSGVTLGSHPGSRPLTKVATLDELLEIRATCRANGRTVVWTNGCFDVLHAGHVSSLRAARELGDVLIVGVSCDDTLRHLKGPRRPIHTLEQRVELLAALEMVDYVHPFSQATPNDILDRLRPDIHCKGADYAPPNGAPMPEADTVRSYGGRVEFLPLVEGLSTSNILVRLGL